VTQPSWAGQVRGPAAERLGPGRRGLGGVARNLGSRGADQQPQLPGGPRATLPTTPPAAPAPRASARSLPPRPAGPRPPRQRRRGSAGVGGGGGRRRRPPPGSSRNMRAWAARRGRHPAPADSLPAEPRGRAPSGLQCFEEGWIGLRRGGGGGGVTQTLACWLTPAPGEAPWGGASKYMSFNFIGGLRYTNLPNPPIFHAN
jgi:hypothetical protein